MKIFLIRQQLEEIDSRIHTIEQLPQISDETQTELHKLQADQKKAEKALAWEAKQIRKELGYTQTDMAELLGYGGQKDVSRIETGKRRMSNQVVAHLSTIQDYYLPLLNVKKD